METRQVVKTDEQLASESEESKALEAKKAEEEARLKKKLENEAAIIASIDSGENMLVNKAEWEGTMSRLAKYEPPPKQ